MLKLVYGQRCSENTGKGVPFCVSVFEYGVVNAYLLDSDIEEFMHIFAVVYSTRGDRRPIHISAYAFVAVKCYIFEYTFQPSCAWKPFVVSPQILAPTSSSPNLDTYTESNFPYRRDERA